MRIGIDFDNTIICYDKAFNKAGVSCGLIPEDLPIGKGFVRDFLRNKGLEEKWIWLQGYIYGTRLCDATIYSGFRHFLDRCRKFKIECFIVSHKTVYPYSGDPYNLHEAAREWVLNERLEVETYFELTKENKIDRICKLGCTHFVDDLPEFLSLKGFPPAIEKILFDPKNMHIQTYPEMLRCGSWDEIINFLKLQ
ncbi:MAG: haloacid dehalogenase-like hydrolase [Proteobacteria bacterium]|nr:haloacid dehalogenase-like hydrolase [Pseudomonadota bacterium]MBU1585242.1 haloacid dehalogenase-like hydrolase [Pseudomonadota bacterium]MBU2453612.1 haloacid dehalogenase-like hydrolase [Pseudomonadota bacterium]MBU2629140.1 haloacid dehalogenase-like hydrolase [Pseudomonadota bacterium]